MGQQWVHGTVSKGCSLPLTFLSVCVYSVGSSVLSESPFCVRQSWEHIEQLILTFTSSATPRIPLLDSADASPDGHSGSSQAVDRTLAPVVKGSQQWYDKGCFRILEALSSEKIIRLSRMGNENFPLLPTSRV